MFRIFRRKPHFSEREVDILRLIVQGKKNKDIALELGIAEQTVKNHITKIFLKLGVKNRTEAAVKVIDKYSHLI